MSVLTEQLRLNRLKYLEFKLRSERIMPTTDRYIFDQYTPKSSVIPGYYEPDFHDIEATASDLLDRFSPTEIIARVRHFDDYLYRLNPETGTAPNDWLTKGDPNGDYCAGTQTIFLNRANRTGLDLSDAFGCKVEVYEALALAALGLIAMAVREEPKLERAGDIQELYWRLGRYVIEGVRLTYAANIIKLNPQTALPVENYRKFVAAKGGEAKSEKYRPLKEAIYTAWLESHQGRSNKEAARRIWAILADEVKLDPEGKSVLNPAEPEATVARWIGDFAKGNAP